MKGLIILKDKEKVASLIAELKSLAENDFELHRINVLERDLTNPPVPEVIDDTHQKFDGIEYRSKENHHYNKNFLLHRAVYTYYYGEIPNGYEIHHSDHNPANNNIENLQCLTKGEHCVIHNFEGTKKQIVCLNCGKTFTFSQRAHKLFCSIKCGNEHRAKNPKLYEERVCEYCGKTFTVLKTLKFTCCSRSCGMSLHWKKQRETEGKPEPDRIKTCPVCGKEFQVPVTNPKKTCCSRACGYQIRKKPCEKICPVCGKTFTLRYASSTQICCSNSCANKLRWENRKAESD